MRKRALVIDDNDSNMTLERDLLEVAGFEVLGAVDATSGIDVARKEKPAIIIMDVRLPDMRGYEATKILSMDKETCDIPIVFVNASVLPEDLVELKNIPNSGFISKPIDTRTFAKEISEYIK
jgi:two-component system cell cycle response regulator DivK